MLHYLEGNSRKADNLVDILGRHIPGEEDPAVLGQQEVVPQTGRVHSPDCHLVDSPHCARRWIPLLDQCQSLIFPICLYQRNN
jgi:hypothetical protein